MNLEDLMEVWRSQDAAPLHGVNETLLRLALRQDEAELRTKRRREMWFASVGMAALVGLTALLLAITIAPSDNDVRSGWDYAVAGFGLAAALILSRMIYSGYRAQTRREEGFGESLRDQLNRQLALLDNWLSFSWADWKTATIMILGFGCSAAVAFVAARINGMPYDEAWRMVRAGFLYSLIGCGIVGLWLRRLVRRDLLPRRRRLEELLKELDAP